MESAGTSEKTWPQTLITFFTCSSIFQRSWIVFSDSPYQKIPPKPLHSAVTRCDIRDTNYVPHARQETPPKISRRNFWCNKNFQKKNSAGIFTRSELEIDILRPQMECLKHQEFIEIDFLAVHCHMVPWGVYSIGPVAVRPGHQAWTPGLDTRRYGPQLITQGSN